MSAEIPTPEEIVSTLAACLCEQLALSPAGPPATCCAVSKTPVIPKCCPGFAWVRPVGAFPTDSFPSQGYTPQRCLPPVWGLQIEMGVARCAPSMDCDPTGNPCCASEAEALTNAFGDLNAMKVALMCCLPATLNIKLDEIEMGGWVLDDPSGGCRQATMSGTIRFADYCSC